MLSGTRKCSEYKYYPQCLLAGALTATLHPHGFALCHQSKLVVISKGSTFEWLALITWLRQG